MSLSLCCKKLCKETLRKINIYVSNATPNIAVYFDNLQVTHIHGPLMQEDHYYPHGLAMAGISDAAITTAAPNIYKANSSSSLAQHEWADGSGLEMYETPARMYDAQVGRFGQVDPLMEQSADASEYAFVLNNPVSMVDPMGLQGQNPYAPGSTFFDNNNGDPWWWSSRPTQAFNIPKKAMDGGGGGVRAVAGGYTFTGDAAGQAFSALLYAITHPLGDGSWEFTVGQNKNGVIGYWQPYGIDGDMGIENNVGVGTRFMQTGSLQGDNIVGTSSTDELKSHTNISFDNFWLGTISSTISTGTTYSSGGPIKANVYSKRGVMENAGISLGPVSLSSSGLFSLTVGVEANKGEEVHTTVPLNPLGFLIDGISLGTTKTEGINYITTDHTYIPGKASIVALGLAGLAAGVIFAPEITIPTLPELGPIIGSGF